MTEATIGYGSKFQIENADASAYVDMGEVFSISLPKAEIEQIDASHMQSPGQSREFIDGMTDNGETSFQMNYIPGSDTDVFLNTILETPVGESRTRTCRIIFPNGQIRQFDANLRNYAPDDLSTDGKMTATATFKLTGAITRGTVSSPPA